ncbi:hypothetical protein E3P92_00757 [Wallemia ichthyophaga]|uniref:FYVE zinc finger domain-containing protein n=1 Tax=Wallemia ichthyophaga TaxID=245174 RepID=A0A4T0GLH5_WALIC|nr:hypothetical protein E3P91_00366 [Wallemia ichthyophaga]TIA83508.1 hypothetical protein E3P98_00738 [Wallemia ichthyophaga]TIB03120.1 hypothetical protein E3P95_00712 [Wallemia ichthyophaga]TIB03942.1 hypothetical protein E3P94_00844 [Wallemia ichthyophaga]TIB14034.1 hypothetical protein E3P90_01414 [Wallemia ichthyophaga]
MADDVQEMDESDKRDKPKTQFKRLDRSRHQFNLYQQTRSTGSAGTSPISTPTSTSIPNINVNKSRNIGNLHNSPASPSPSSSTTAAHQPVYQLDQKSRTPSFTSNFSGISGSGAAPGAASAPYKRTPYRVGFQPKGVVRDRFHDLVRERDKHKRDDKDILNHSRLLRRLDKLVELHINHKRKHGDSFGLLSDIKLRANEQNIVNWEDDKLVDWCPIAHIQFNPFKYRKHHCRLCGRVVSAAEVARDALKSKASFEMKRDDYGRMMKLDDEQEQKQQTGIRVCLDCWRVVEKQEMKIVIPRYMGAYEEAIALEKELEVITSNRTLNTSVVMEKIQRMEELMRSFNEPTALCRAITTRFRGKLGKYTAAVRSDLEQSRRVRRSSGLNDSGESRDRHLQALFVQQSQLLKQIDSLKEERRFEDLSTLQENLEIVNKFIQEN